MPGRHLLSLCGESKQRRIKGKRETVRCGFPLPFEIPSPFDRSLTASARQVRGVLRLRKRQGSPRDVGDSTFNFANCARTSFTQSIR